MKAKDLMSNLGMSNVVNFKLNVTNSGYNSKYTDQHVSEVSFGHRKVTYNGETREIIQVVVRGTNGTMDEWESNFDVGTTKSFDSVSDWKNSSNHMGFDVTANRIRTMLNTYVKRNVSSSATPVYWITGHSRGAAIANIIGAYLADDYKTVYAYTYASPNTTTSSDRSNAKYGGIFNLVNQDDFVPMLPTTYWNFGHYGKTAIIDMTGDYEKEWESYTGIGDYNPDTFGLDDTIKVLGKLVDDRNDLYVTDSRFEYEEKLKKTTNSAAQKELDAFKKSLPLNYSRSGKLNPLYYGFTLRWIDYGFFENKTYYGYTLTETPAYFMQGLAGIMSGDIDGMGFIVDNDFKLGSGFNSARFKLASSYLGGLSNPHYTETYHILSTHVSASNFKWGY